MWTSEQWQYQRITVSRKIEFLIIRTLATNFVKLIALFIFIIVDPNPHLPFHHRILIVLTMAVKKIVPSPA